MSIRIMQGDCREVMKTLADASVDSIVCDPPYHLTQASRGGHARTNNPMTPHGRTRIGDKGFMGMVWDGGDTFFQPDTWAGALRVLKPGGHLLAFGGTRTYHRLACAIEDAGFEIRDMGAWFYGSGFPKSTNPCKCTVHIDSGNVDAFGWKLCATCGKQFELGTALKPALEPICVARRPLIGTIAKNIAAHGTGALNIDGCRILNDGEIRPANTGRGAIPARHSDVEPRAGGVVAQPHELGRWPANLMHDGSDAVLSVFPQAPGQMADASSSSGSRKTQNVYGAMRRGRGDEPTANADNHGAVGFKLKPGARRLGEGSAARFFYCAKADRADRNDGLDGMPLRQSGMVSNTSGQHMTRRDGGAPPPAANHHPTVKPTDLMRNLVRLVTPPNGTVLDICIGSGSTLKAAELEGFSAIGIEIDPEYIAIARRRIASDAPLFAEVA